ncbi:hypothetical protein UFOVP26_98 [uncultured Caudovirales phage]|uniref:Uncharacterized protein n=1 Tax=uncultured Caudovirales phage TaxID=2100421 RepID=A0A6J7WSK8_9CAUD|nr:hypothetical protein UFOVP26_98 [uncultured Caudovirales phage]CAB4124036.1 hypothetical protein UFOVP44_137 [uncultured Caudovirales phage]CAB5219712.1 hypothetical protein UFOVP220_128 [uncultured Caudovirales phage]
MLKKFISTFRDGLKNGIAPNNAPIIETGYHNSVHIRGDSYFNKSTAVFTPSRQAIRAEVVNAWMNLMYPINHRTNRLMISGEEVGDAYNTGFLMMLNHQAYSNCAYMLLLEDDNIVPPDAILRLIETIEGKVDGNKYDIVGGLYWSHDIDGIPYCMGSDELYEGDFNSTPLVPLPNKQIIPCHVVGLGCCLVRMSFIREKMEYPYFQTKEIYDATKEFFDRKDYISQDGTFFKKVHALGGKVACDTRVKVGHIDRETGFIW